eukprot:Hpha_TRINITY_DN16232_c1_g3::TRINITY_DN16232_c1_g3_i2::g.14399::m.14399
MGGEGCGKMAEGEEVDVQLDSFLPFSLERLTECLKQRIRTPGTGPDPQEQWEDFVCNMRCVCALYYESVSSRIRRVLTDKVDDVTPEQEGEFLQQTNLLLEAGQFVPLTKSVYETAQAIDFEFVWPCEVDWRHYDPAFLSSRKANLHGEMDEVDFADRILVYTRGTGTTQRTDRFIVPKINLLLDRLLRCRKRKPEAPPQQKSCASPVHASHSIHEKQSQARLILSQVYPAGLFGMLRDLFKKVTIREPTFKDVCLVYKQKPILQQQSTFTAAKAMLKFQQGLRQRRKSRVPESTSPKVAAERERRMSRVVTKQAETSQETLIHVDLYKDVPFGDLEGILPYKKVQLQILHKLVFLAKIIIAVVVLLLTIKNMAAGPTPAQKAEGGRPKGTLMLLGLIVAAVAKQVIGLFFAYRGLRKQYDDAVMQWMQAHRAAVQMPVISSLVDDVRAQEVKEAVLAYFFLWQEGEAQFQNLGWVDERVEEFLLESMETVVDFDVEDAVEKLVTLGLAEKREGLPSLRGGTEGEEAEYKVVMSPSQWLAKYPHQNLFGLKLRD